MSHSIISGSIVLYKNDDMVHKAISSFLSSHLPVRLYLIDNSPTDELRMTLKHFIDRENVEYIFVGNNVGFGAGHNIAMRKSVNESLHHVIINPDVEFTSNVVEELDAYLQRNANVGLVVPKVLNTDGSIQYLNKLLPTPFDFFIIRFLPFAFKKKQADFRLEKSNYDKEMSVPFLSGCFMMFKTSVLSKINFFDEKIFMYTEDIDICRRVIKSGFDTVYYPEVSIYHHHTRKSFRSFKVFKTYFQSAIYYFNKWGWFFDTERRTINKATLNQIPN